MDIEKLMTEYIALQWKLLDAVGTEKRQSVEAELAAIKGQLDAAGVYGDSTYSHDSCGGVVVRLTSAEQMYYCVHCHQKGDVEVRFEHDFSGYATFIGEASN